MAQTTYHHIKGKDLDAAAVTLNGLQYALTTVSGDGAIPITSGIYMVTKGSAAALTLAAPTAGAASAGGDDGKVITVVSTTAAAHVITGSVDGFNAKGSSGTITFAANIGSATTVIARNGHWYTVSGIGATVA